MRERYLDEQTRIGSGESLPVDAWPDSVKLLIQWLEQTQLPATFDLAPGHRVADGAKYREYLLRALEGAPAGAAARAAAYWLRELHRQFGNTAVLQTKIPQTA